jgi:hypothetical protein
VTNENDAEAGIPSSSLEPRPRDLLDYGRRRPAYDEARVLVPDGREPVRGERGRNGAADHKAEVAAARDADDAGLCRPSELLDHVASVDRLGWQRPAERSAQLLYGRRWPHRTLVERLEEVGSQLGHALQQLALAHGRGVYVRPSATPCGWRTNGYS